MSKPRRRRGVIPQKVRCKATNRHGEQCHKWAMKGSVVCNKHGGAAPQVRRKAQERIAMAQDDAASLLVRFMADKDVPYPERRRCAEFLLTYENRNEVQITLAKWEQDIEGLVFDTGDDDIVDGEVVEDEPRAIPPSDAEWRAEVLTEEDSEPSSVRGNRYRGR
jgi:hypothetical protein